MRKLGGEYLLLMGRSVLGLLKPSESPLSPRILLKGGVK
jgi:hypothetical protein